MPGVTTHLIISAIGFIVCTLAFRHYKYGLAFIFGHILPDAIKFGLTGVVFNTTSFSEIVGKPMFLTLDIITHRIYLWLAIFVLASVLLFMLSRSQPCRARKTKKSTLKSWFLINFIFFMAVAIHLGLDIRIIEKSFWK